MRHQLNLTLYELAKEQFNAEFQRRNHIQTMSAFVFASTGLIGGVLFSFYSGFAVGFGVWHIFFYLTLLAVVVAGWLVFYYALAVFHPRKYRYMPHASEVLASFEKTDNQQGQDQDETLDDLLIGLTRKLGDYNKENANANDKKSESMSKLIRAYLFLVLFAIVSAVPFYFVRSANSRDLGSKSQRPSALDLKGEDSTFKNVNESDQYLPTQEDSMFRDGRRQHNGGDEETTPPQDPEKPVIPDGRDVFEGDEGDPTTDDD